MIIQRNLFEVLEKLYPGAIISHRSAFEFLPTKAGHILLTYKYTKKVELPGVTIRFLEGPAPVEGNHPFSGQLFVSQQARAFLENLRPGKKPGPASKTLTIPEIKERLEQIIRIHMIPTVFRDDFLGVLRKLTRQSDPEPLIRMLLRAYDFSLTVRGEDMDRMQLYLENCNAFLEPSEGKLDFQA